jgi:hypothetical protein
VLRLRRAWLIAIACVAMIAGGSALVMRIDLLDGAGTLSPTVYGRSLAVHALAMVGVFVAAFIALPTLILPRVGRATIALGVLACAVWTAVTALFIGVAAFAPEDWLDSSRLGQQVVEVAVVVLGATVGLGIVQLVSALPATFELERRNRTVAAFVGAIAALAIVGIPLATGDLPSRLHLLTATSVAACSVAPTTLASATRPIVWFAIAPCVATAWVMTAMIGQSDALFLDDTVAMLAPFPALGGAIVAALFAIAARERQVRPWLVRVGATMFAGGTIATSVWFLNLGTRGMPRRYHAYDDSFQTVQIAIGVATVVTLVGAIAAAASTRRART